MRHGMRRVVVVTALSILGSGCATEEWTLTLFSKREAEVDERFAEHGQRIERVEGRVSHLEVKMTETRDQLVAATSPATTEQKVTLWRPVQPTGDPTVHAGRTLVAVIHVLFGFNRADLDAGAEPALAAIMNELRTRPRATIELEGTTDSIGQFDYNVRLSQRRIQAVIRWLTQKGVDQTRIVGSTSRGPLADPSVTDAAKRRVMVKVMTPPDK